MTEKIPMVAGAIETGWAGRLVRFYARRWPLIIGVALVTFVWAVAKADRGLRFVTDRNDILATHEEYHREFLAYKAEFGAEDDIVLVVSSPDVENNHRMAVTLGRIAREDHKHFRIVYDRLDLTFARSHLLFYLSVEQLKGLDKRLKEARPLLAQVLRTPGLEPLFYRVNEIVQSFVEEQIARALRGGIRGGVQLPEPPEIASSIPILTRLLQDMTSSMEAGYKYQSPWPEMLEADLGDAPMPEVPTDFYIEFDQGRTVLVLVKPHLDVGAYNPTAAAMTAIQDVVKRARAEVPGVDVGISGKPVMENDEMVTGTEDSEYATVLTVLGVIALFGITYQNLGRPFLAMITLTICMGWTLGFATVAIGHLNVLSVTVMPMLVGLGIDFGIQVITRYEEERVEGYAPLDAMALMLGGTGGSVLTAGITTAVSFLAVWLTDMKGIQELAIMASAGIALSVLAMLVVLPTLLLAAEQTTWVSKRPDGMRWSRLHLLAFLEDGMLSHPWGVVFIGLMFTAACIPSASRWRFDGNVLNLQTPETVAMVQKLESASKRSLLFAEVIANDLDEARDLEKRLMEKKLTVLRVESAVPVIPEHQEEKIPLVRSVQETLKGLPPMGKLPAEVDVPSLGRAVTDLRDTFLLIWPRARSADMAELATWLRDFVQTADKFLERVVRLGFPTAQGHLHQYEADLFHDIDTLITLLRGSDQATPMGLADIPEEVRMTMVGPSGRLLLHVFPKDDVWDNRAMKAFLNDVRSVYPKATGAPVQIYESTQLLRTRYQRAAQVAFIVIALVVLLQFRALLPTVLVLTPLLLGLIWMVGLQGMFGIAFNAVNFLAFSLILGIGVANGIYIVRRFQEENCASIFSVSTGRAILLSNLTAMMGFGSLMVSRHQGMYSVGLVMALGIAVCMFASLIFLPALLQILKDQRIRV
ncbi:MAG: hypothetical protein FJX76_11910 [Armatimonadetes bacterium]|nr:hypothetical protein [Armatimonadota bacterium]